MKKHTRTIVLALSIALLGCEPSDPLRQLSKPHKALYQGHLKAASEDLRCGSVTISLDSEYFIDQAKRDIHEAVHLLHKFTSSELDDEEEREYEASIFSELAIKERNSMGGIGVHWKKSFQSKCLDSLK
jgi:hypothetical protein